MGTQGKSLCLSDFDLNSLTVKDVLMTIMISKGYYKYLDGENNFLDFLSGKIFPPLVPL